MSTVGLLYILVAADPETALHATDHMYLVPVEDAFAFFIIGRPLFAKHHLFQESYLTGKKVFT